MKFLKNFTKNGSGALRREHSGERSEELDVDLSLIRGIRAQYRHGGDSHSSAENCGIPSPPSPLGHGQLSPLSPQGGVETRRKVDVRASRRNSLDVSRVSEEFFSYSEVLQKKSSERVIKLTLAGAAAASLGRRGSLTESAAHPPSLSLDGCEGSSENVPVSPAASTPKSPPKKPLTLILPDSSPTSVLDWEPAQDMDTRRSPGSLATPFGTYLPTPNGLRSASSAVPWPSPGGANLAGHDRDGLCGPLLFYGPEAFVPEPRREAPETTEDACVYLAEEVRYLQDQIWRVRNGFPSGSNVGPDTREGARDAAHGAVFDDIGEEGDEEEDDDSSVDIEQELRELAEEQELSEEVAQLESEVLWLQAEVVAFRQLLTGLEVRVFLKQKEERLDPAVAALPASRRAAGGEGGRRAMPKLHALFKGEPHNGIPPPTPSLHNGRMRTSPAAGGLLDMCQLALLSELTLGMQEERACVEELCRLHRHENTMAELDLLYALEEEPAPGPDAAGPAAHGAAAQGPAQDGSGQLQDPTAGRQGLASVPPPPGRGAGRRLPWSRTSQSKVLPLHGKQQGEAKEGAATLLAPHWRKMAHQRSSSVDGPPLPPGALDCDSKGIRATCRMSSGSLRSAGSCKGRERAAAPRSSTRTSDGSAPWGPMRAAGCSPWLLRRLTFEGDGPQAPAT